MWLEHYNAATAEERAFGWGWYTRARAIVRGLAEMHGVSVQQAAGIVAALSQRNQWGRNLTMAVQVLEGRKPAGLRQAVNRAVAIRGGADVDATLRGPKVRAFYRALLGDDDAIVLDVWMLRTGGMREKPTDGQYRRGAMRLSMEAAALKIPPAVYQAIVWVHVRGAA